MAFFSLFKGSFHSAETYRAARSSGKSYLGYALKLVALSALLVVLYIGGILYTVLMTPNGENPPLFDSLIQQVAQQMPLMTLKDNVLVTKDPVATVINFSTELRGQPLEVPLMTIDTTGTTTVETMTTPILITSNEIYTRTEHKTEITPLSELTKNISGTLVINRAMATDTADRFINYVHTHILKIGFTLTVLAWVFFAAFMFIMRASMLLVLGMAGLCIASVLKTKLSYANAVALAALSYTPIAMLDLVLFAGIGYPASSGTLFLAGCVALVMAIRITTPPAPRVLVG